MATTQYYDFLGEKDPRKDRKLDARAVMIENILKIYQIIIYKCLSHFDKKNPINIYSFFPDISDLISPDDLGVFRSKREK